MLNVVKLLFSNFPTSRKLKLIWFIKNIYYASMSKIRKKKSQYRELSDANNNSQAWKDFEEHFNFIFEHYPSKNILYSPMVQYTMYTSFAIEHQILNKNIKNLIISLSNRIDTAFNLRENNSLGFLSTFGALMQKCEELNPGILEKMKGEKLIEFGPGLGFASLFFSKLFDTKIIHYDLSAVTQIRNLCLNHYSQNNSDFYVQPEEFENFDKLEARVSSLNNYSFISTWAFTESPLSIRKKFEYILSKSSVAIIVSNSNFGDVNNFNYLNDLASKLTNHRHTKCDLSFLKNAPSFQKQHQLHLFTSV